MKDTKQNPGRNSCCTKPTHLLLAGLILSFAIQLVFTPFGPALRAEALRGHRHPAGVPEGFVGTPFGYFHPSCVRQLTHGDSLKPNKLAIRHEDGSFETMPVCNYPHYDAKGNAVPDKPNALEQGTAPTISHSWIEDYSVTTGSEYGELTASWTVPPAPLSNDGQILYFFPGMEDIDDVISILQPVLAWNYDASNPYAPLNAWSIASWNCCIVGPGSPYATVYESTPVTVHSGDTIAGLIASTCSAGTVGCEGWNVNTVDQTSGQSSDLSMAYADGQIFNWAFAGAVEVYYISQCSDYPANASISFTNLALYDDNFSQIASPAWSFDNWYSSLTPQCSYGGQETATQATLDYAPAGTATHAGMTWSVEGGSPLVHVGADGVTNPYNGDTAATAVLPILCIDVTGAALPGELTPDFYDGWVEGNLQLTAPISGTLLNSLATANGYCSSSFGSGWVMAEFHDGWYGTNLASQSGWHFWGNAIGLFPATQRFWVTIDDQVANPWNTLSGSQATHAGMTWSVEGGSPIVHAGADGVTNPYSGDTAATAVLPILCIDVTGAALPGELTPDFYDGWVEGNLELSAPISGTFLTSRATADGYCAATFGSGWRMAEFHDGWYGTNLASQSGWHFWGNALGLFPSSQRFWVAIDDQVANPWGE